MITLDECIRFCETNYEYYKMRPGYKQLAERYSSIVCFLMELKSNRVGGDDSYTLGYKQAIADYDKAIKEAFLRDLEKAFIEGDKKTDWDFQRDYHGQFKKKEDKDDRL